MGEITDAIEARATRRGYYYGWNILAVGMLFQAVIFGIGFFCFTFWVAPWRAEFGGSRGDVMAILVAVQVVMGCLAPFAGRAMDRLSIRVLVVGGSLSFAAALALSSLATALWQIGVIYGTLLVAGTLLAGPLAAQTLAAKWFFARRGAAIGLSSVGTSLGGFVLPVLVTYLIAAYGWRQANVMLALLVVVVVVPAVWLVVRNTPQARGVEPEPDLQIDAGMTAHVFPNWSTRDIFRQRAFWVSVIAFTPMMATFGAAQQNFAPYTADLGIDAQATSYLVSLMAIVMVAGKVFFGTMSDRWDHRWLYGIAIVVLLAALGLMMLDPGYAQLVIISGLLGFAGGGFLPLLGAIVGSRFGPAAFGQVMGLVGPFTTLAAVGPWVAGFLRDTSGSYDLAWLVFALLVIPAAFTMILLTPRPEPQASSKGP
ncbi:MAG: MFS transporter [Gammaproteobacteria bacterium]|nr:MFS transporter [Gammaproteobacteria bacterium]